MDNNNTASITIGAMVPLPSDTSPSSGHRYMSSSPPTNSTPPTNPTLPKSTPIANSPPRLPNDIFISPGGPFSSPGPGPFRESRGHFTESSDIDIFQSMSFDQRRSSDARQSFRHVRPSSLQQERLQSRQASFQSRGHTHSVGSHSAYDDDEEEQRTNEYIRNHEIPAVLLPGPPRSSSNRSTEYLPPLPRSSSMQSASYVPSREYYRPATMVPPPAPMPPMPHRHSSPHPHSRSHPHPHPNPHPHPLASAPRISAMRQPPPAMRPYSDEKSGSSTVYWDEKHPPRLSRTPRSSETNTSMLKASIKPLAISRFHEILFVGTVIMANFMALAGLGQAIAPRDIIGASLGTTSPGEKAWFAASYSLTVGTFILISGRMGDILGHKRMLVFGYCFLGIWSGFAGFSAFIQKQIYFDVCRAFQGMGAAMLAPNALALLGRAYPPGTKKNVIFSLFGAMAPWGFVAGAAAASFFAQVLWWPWLFWSYGVAAWGLAIMALLVIPRSLGHDSQFEGQDTRVGMDWMGAICGVTGLVLVNVAWNNAPLYGWQTPHVYFILAMGIFALIAFVWVEIHTEFPLVPSVAINRTALWTLLLVAFGWGSFGIWMYYSWRFIMDLRNYSPLWASAQFTPVLVSGLLAAGVTGLFLTHTPVAFTMLVSMCAFFLGSIVAATQPVNQLYWIQMFVSLVIMPFGIDMSFPAATLILSNNMPREHQGLAASLVLTVVNYSISLALGIAGTVEVSVNNGGALAIDVEWGIRCAYYTGLGLSGCGVLFGILFLARSLMKEGWKVMEH